MKHVQFPSIPLDLERKESPDADPIGELKAAFAEHHAEMKNQIGALDKHMAGLETEMRRPKAGSGDEVRETPESKSFIAYCRTGLERMDATERKSLTIGSDPQSGYLAPAEFQRELARNLVQFSPIRAAARIGQTSAGKVHLPKRTSAMSGYWVGETEGRSETTPAYGLDQIPINELAAYCDISNWMLEDAAFDMAAELALDFAESFGATEGAAFVNGDGVARPEGIMAAADVPEVVTGAATTVTADSLRTILFNLPAYYRARSTWLLNGSTLGSVAKMKDGNGQYLWAPGSADGPPATLLGRPVVEAPDMPSEGAGLYPVVLGDFSRYRIFDRVLVSVLRDPYTQAASGMVRFYGRRRVGAQCQLPEAFRKLKCSV